MLSSRLENLAEVIMENETNPNIDKDIIVYGLNSAIEQGASMFTAVLLGWIFGLTAEIIVFMVSFTLIRTYAGGYHCKKALNCYIMSSGIIVGVLAIVKFIPNGFVVVICFTVLALSIPTLYKTPPVETPTKPLDEIEKKYYQKKKLINLFMETVVIFFLLSINLYSFALIICLGILVSLVVVLIGKFINL